VEALCSLAPGREPAGLLEGGVEGHEAHVLARSPDDVIVSAATGEGLDALLIQVEDMLWRGHTARPASGLPRQDGLHPH
jgi:hypothetical protein